MIPRPQLLCLFPTFACLLRISVVTGQDIRRPPSVSLGYQKLDTIIKENNDVPTQFTCSATGTPKPTIEWLHNGLAVVTGGTASITSQDHSKTLTILHSRERDEGYYQCVATSQTSNKALSDVISVRLAVTEEVPEKPVTSLQANVGDSLKIQCQPGKAYPPPTFQWGLANNDMSQPINIEETIRISTDYEGTLYFANVLKTDEKKGMSYKCGVYNPYTDIRMFVSATKIVVNEVNAVNKAPSLLYGSKNQVVVQGREVQLKCIFAGRPTPTVEWIAGSGNLPSGHVVARNELKIKNIRVEDSSNYVCVGKNEMGEERHTVTVVVKKAPTFINEPVDTNITEGLDAVFRCEVDADPPAQVGWSINGMPLAKGGIDRVELSEADTKLTVRTVCKDCSNSRRSSDLLNIQCNASNEHGYAFKDVYLNVLISTKIVKGPPGEVMLDYYMPVQLPCDSVSDDSTPINTMWKKDGVALDFTENQIFTDEKGGLHMMTENAHQGGMDLLGVYTCYVTNGYSNDTTSVHLVKPPYSPTPPPSTTPAPFPVVLVASSSGAFIFLLLLLLICCCCCWCYRDRGSLYRVEKYEVKHGFEPEKELKRSEFQEYHRPIDHSLVTGSRGSLGSRAQENVSMSSSLNLGASAENLIKSK